MNVQCEYKVFPRLQIFITRKLCGIQKYFFLTLLKLVFKILCHVFIVTLVTFGFWMQHFQTGGLGEMVRHPDHYDRRISPPPLDFFLRGYVKDKVFSTPVPDITNLKARITCFCCSNWRHVGEHVERNWLSIRRSPCNRRSTCWGVLMCCKKTSWVALKKILYSTYSSFLVINVCNQGKTLCSPCRTWL